DRVTAASQAQLVNTIAPIRTEPDGPAWRQSTFHPFALTARNATGTVLDLRLDNPVLETGRYGAVAVLDAVATHDAGSGRLALFVVNRHPSDSVSLATGLDAWGGGTLLEAVLLADEDHPATVTEVRRASRSPTSWTSPVSVTVRARRRSATDSPAHSSTSPGSTTRRPSRPVKDSRAGGTDSVRAHDSPACSLTRAKPTSWATGRVTDATRSRA